MPRKIVVMTLLALALPLAACNESTGVGGPGTFTVLLTDEPAFEAAWVTIDRVDLVGGNGNGNGDGDADGDGGGIVPLLSSEDGTEWEPQTVNLVALNNDIKTLVQDYPVPPGSYSQLRFGISGACVVMAPAEGEPTTEMEHTQVYASEGYAECGEASGQLQLPSWGQSGFKVQLPGGHVEVDDYRVVVLLDFVLGDSFGPHAGNSGRWIMRPHVKATRVEFSGTILVELTSDEGAFDPVAGLEGSPADFQARLEQDGTSDGTLMFTDDDADGVFTAFFQWLVPGDYTVRLELPEQVEGEGPPYLFATTGDTQIDVTVPDSGDMTASFHITCAFPDGETESACDSGGGGD